MSRHLINIKSTLSEALRKLNDLSGAVMTLFVIDDGGKVAGTITDGDIRRALIAGASLDGGVDQAMHRNFRAVTGDAYDVAELRDIRRANIRLIPHLNADGTLRDIIDLTVCPTRLPLQAILMAGGKGERLRPLTLNTPKPLLEIDGKPIIDYNIEALARCGVTDIFVTTRYLAEQIHEHFSSPVCGVSVKCIKEDAPLGTIGAASLAPLKPDGYTLVMNSDLLTTISFEDMWLHHQTTGADITIAAIPYQVSIPFAVLSTSESDPAIVTGIEEKPSYSYYANAGIYIFPNKLLRSLPSDRRTDATDLIEEALQSGLRVTYFPINGTWIDIGSPTDFRQATELMRHVSTLNSTYHG